MLWQSKGTISAQINIRPISLTPNFSLVYIPRTQISPLQEFGICSAMADFAVSYYPNACAVPFTQVLFIYFSLLQLQRFRDKEETKFRSCRKS
jgi:hypothetical protein